jgi:hypothetical protein
MSTYIVDRSTGTLTVTVKETGDAVSLYHNIHDTGVAPVTFGDHPDVADGGADQLAFALLYDAGKNKALSIKKYPKLSRHLTHAVPQVIELAKTDLVAMLSK